MSRKLVLAAAVLVLFARTGWAQEFGPIKESMWPDADTTETVRLAVRSAAYVWERDTVGCHDDMTSAIENSAVSDATKVALLIQIPRALRMGGVARLWNNSSQELRRMMMRAAADNLIADAEKLEARAAVLRAYATRIDDGAGSYTTSMGF